jgi:hypothetical protein
MNPAWAGWQWNPAQAGDSYGNPSTVVASSNNGEQIYVKTIPKQWALNNVDSECSMETWITLEDTVAHVHNRLTNYRSDPTLYQAYAQELPAVYTIGTLNHLVTYSGVHPFTGGAITEYNNPGTAWEAWRSTENWAALVNSSNPATAWGLGVFHPGSCEFIGGFGGPRGVGGPTSASCGYIAPLRYEILDSNIVYDYDYDLILGNLSTIRSYVDTHQPDTRPDYRFSGSRAHWWFYANAADTGTPALADHLRVMLPESDPQMYGPYSAWRAEDAPMIYIRAAYHLNNPDPGDLLGQLFWDVNNSGTFGDTRYIYFPIINDGAYHTYAIDLSSVSSYTGLISQLRFDPVIRGAAGDYVDIQFISSIVPEPASIILLGMGALFALFATFVRRRMTAKARP